MIEHVEEEARVRCLYIIFAVALFGCVPLEEKRSDIEKLNSLTQPIVVVAAIEPKARKCKGCFGHVFLRGANGKFVKIIDQAFSTDYDAGDTLR